MEENKIIFDALIESIDGSEEDFKEATAALALNSAMSFAKFIFTPDTPNQNKQRIPQEEFDNVIRTGLFSPFKMAKGEISDGHKGGVPIGVVTHLKKENNCIKGLAGLWKGESEFEIKLLKEKLARGEKPQVSWEVSYRGEDISEEGVATLRDVSVTGVMVVGRPAYAGGTPILAMAAVETPDKNTDMEENTHVTNEEYDTKILELETANTVLKQALADKDVEVASVKEENTTLAEFKLNIEKEQTKNQKVASVKTKFEKAGISKDEDYFNTHSDELLGMEDSVLDFMLQEMVSFATATATAALDSKNKEGLPPIVSDTTTFNIKEIASSLRKLKN